MPNPTKPRNGFRSRPENSLALACCAFLFAASPVAAAPPSSLPNGLQLVPGAKLDVAYARPGIDLKKYKTIELKPLLIPQKVRNAAPPGTFPEGFESYVLRDDDVADLQAGYVQVMHDTLGKAGYTFVTVPQADTLVVSVQVANITLNAPIEDTRNNYSGPGITMSRGAGSMAIAAVLADGLTGVVLAEAADRQYSANIWRANNRVSNLADARTAFGLWARALSDRLTGGPATN